MRRHIEAYSRSRLVRPASDQELSVPSGQKITLLERLEETQDGALWFRYRYLAPAIARGGAALGFERAAVDMAHLCQTHALTDATAQGQVPVGILISLSDRPVPFGAPAPEATQFFEAYRIENGVCVLEAF